MNTRLDRTMTDLRKAGKKGLFIYLTAGAPDRKATMEAVQAAERAGADVIELGIPFSDPMADGPVIQAAAAQAIRQGMTVHGVLDIVREIREISEIPLVGMGYINNVLNYGFEAFVHDAKAAGLDGLILPDVPHEESGPLHKLCKAKNFHLIEFVTPGTTPQRMQETCKDADGFIYCVSVNGVTGERRIDYAPIGRVAELVRKTTDVPLAVGFGIGSPEAAVEAAAHADAVIVGSAVVRRVMKKELSEAEVLIASIRQALDAQR